MHAARQPRSWLIFDVRRMKSTSQLVLFFILLPTVAFAHGQEVLGLPIGQIVSLTAVLAAAFLIRLRPRRKAVLFFPALGVPFLTWVVPNFGDFILHLFGDRGTAYFMLGVIPPLFVAAFAYFAFCRPTSHSKDDETTA